jgi:hypothetical protein
MSIELLDMIVRCARDVTGKPVGIKTAIGGWRFHERPVRGGGCAGLARRPISLPSMAARAAGAAPQAWPTTWPVDRRGLARVVDTLIEFGLRQRVRRSLPPASW